VPIYLTCAVVETPEAYVFGLDLALRMDAPQGTGVQADPHVSGVRYLESTVEAVDLPTALVSAGLAAAALVAGAGLPGEVVEITVIDEDGALTWQPTAGAPTVESLAAESDSPRH
jgi:hypothetical protein